MKALDYHSKELRNMALTKKGKVKEFMQNQAMFGNQESGVQMKAKVIARINGLEPDDPRLVDLMYNLTGEPKQITWTHIVAIGNSLGLMVIAFLGFIS